MATTSGRRGLIAQEDTKAHDPTVGASGDVFDPSQAGFAQTFSRTSQSGGTVSRTKVSALSIPIIDGAVVAGAQSPFNTLEASNHSVETALRDIRVNIPHYKNLEHYGAISGPGVSSGVAAKNTAVWNKLVSDIGASGRNGGIFIPNGIFEFGGSSPDLEIVSKSNINIIGAGAGSVIRANAAGAEDLLRLTDCSNIKFVDVQLDKISNTAGTTCNVRASAARIDNISFYNVIFTRGITGLRLDNASKHGTTFWVRDCTFSQFLTKGVYFTDWGLGRITGSTFDAGSPGQMIYGDAPQNNDLMVGCEISNNKSLSTQKSDIFITRGGTYNGSIHQQVIVSSNNISVGDIYINGINRPTANNNDIQLGNLHVGFAGAATLEMPRMIGNYVNGSGGHGIHADFSCDAVSGLEISGGRVSNAQNVGIYVTAPGATTFNRYMRIYGVNVINCSQVGNGNSSGIRIDGTATSGTTDSIVTGNVIVSTAAPKHKYGIEETAGGGSTRNLFFGNSIVGWVTGALLGPSAGIVNGDNLSTGP